MYIFFLPGEPFLKEIGYKSMPTVLAHPIFNLIKILPYICYFGFSQDIFYLLRHFLIWMLFKMKVMEFSY